MSTPATRINLTKNEKTGLETLARTGTATQRMTRGCRVIPLAAQRTPNRAITRQVGCFATDRLGGAGRLSPRRCGSSGAGEPPFTPTSSSWLNQVERWFAEITRKRIRRGSLNSVQELEKAIYEYLAAWNETPKLFVWKATADSMLEKVKGCKELNVTGHWRSWPCEYLCIANVLPTKILFDMR
jgi:transposase